ncbi:hypothetical protein V8D89_001159 [Ganoderma adspersum]
MSIGTQTQNEKTPVVPAIGNTKPTHHRTKSIAEQIAQSWRALHEDEQEKWTAAAEAEEEASEFEPFLLHLKAAPIPADRELFIEQFPTEPKYTVADVAASNNTTWFVDDHTFGTGAIALPGPIAGPTMLPPWRLPGAFSDGLENVPLLKPTPTPKDDDKEAAKKTCVSLESEKQIQQLEAFLLANRKPDSERPVPLFKGRCPVKGQIRGYWEHRMRQRIRTSEGIPIRFHSWWW